MKNNIKMLREGKGWTLEDLAERTGYSKQYLSAIENHDKRLNGTVMDVVSDVFGCGIIDLINIDDTPLLKPTDYIDEKFFIQLYDIIENFLKKYKPTRHVCIAAALNIYPVAMSQHKKNLPISIEKEALDFMLSRTQRKIVT